MQGAGAHSLNPRLFARFGHEEVYRLKEMRVRIAFRSLGQRLCIKNVVIRFCRPFTCRFPKLMKLMNT